MRGSIWIKLFRMRERKRCSFMLHCPYSVRSSFDERCSKIFPVILQKKDRTNTLYSLLLITNRTVKRHSGCLRYIRSMCFCTSDAILHDTVVSQIVLKRKAAQQSNNVQAEKFFLPRIFTETVYKPVSRTWSMLDLVFILKWTC